MIPRTLAGRFLSIVAFGAVLPLALVGLWLTRTANRSGIDLLHGQLDHAAEAVIGFIDQRWASRDGELRLLANNTAAIAAVRSGAMAADERAYLDQLGHSFAGSIPAFEYRDLIGHTRWRLAQAVARDFPAKSDSMIVSSPARTLSVEMPVEADGKRIGTLVAQVALASVLGSGLGQALIPGASLTILDNNGATLVGGDDAQSAGTNGRFGIESIARSARVAPLRIIIAAPSAPYVRPFDQAARKGVGVLMIVALLALATSWFVTARVTHSLAELSDAASAVAAGNLSRTVTATGDGEVGRLAQAFNDMTTSLRHTLAELSQQRSLAAVGEFAASLSHEVRNSLTAVRVDLQHARRHLPADAPGGRLVGRALESVRRLDGTVSGALRIARSGQVARTRLDLNDVLQRAMLGAEPSFAEHQAILEPLDTERRVAIDGDAGALEQLFLNLLINAAQASSPGARARVEIEAAPHDALVRIVDAGRGIDDALLVTTGAPFHTTKENGTGLGLPIARRIAVAHGGDLTLEKAAARGTIAVVRLPRSPA